MSPTGLAYLHPWTYAAIMRVLHWGAFDERYKSVAKHVRTGDVVVDLCCGDAMLSRHLPPHCRYIGLDANRRFVAHAQRRGIDARLWDASTEEIPEADVVVIQSSLYQFHPDDTALAGRAFTASRRTFVIAEPVENWTTHGTRWQKFLARRMTRVSGRQFDFRHDETTLDILVSTLSSRRVVKERSGRDLVIAIDK